MDNLRCQSYSQAQAQPVIAARNSNNKKTLTNAKQSIIKHTRSAPFSENQFL